MKQLRQVLPTVFARVAFFQAEDGMRDLTVTGVQTCALPISAGLETDILDRRVRYHRRARTGHAQRRRVRADPPQPRSEWVRVCQRAVHPELPLPIGRRGACREVPARGRRAPRRPAAGGGAAARGGGGRAPPTPPPQPTRPPTGPPKAGRAGAI